MNKTPAELWIGSSHILEQEIITSLQKKFCSQNGCTTCITCTSIAAKQHHQCMWFEPEKSYSLATLEPLFEKIAFANEVDKTFYFIFQKADLLTTACANSLLKSVEEPPAGYHFIFLAERLHAIIPTIRSRCTTKTFKQEEQSSEYALLLQSFKQATDPLAFLQILDKNTPNEQESLYLIDDLLAYWMREYTKNQNPEIDQKIHLLQEALKRPPMPGSSKIFWRNLFLSFSL